MNKYRESVRLISTTNLKNAAIAKSVGFSPNTIKKQRKLLMDIGRPWHELKVMDDLEIQSLLVKTPIGQPRKPEPDWLYIHSQKQMRDVTLQLLFREYRKQFPEDGYEYSSFTERYRKFVSKLDLSMRQTHLAGEKTFVDFAGRRIPYQRPGEPEKYAEIFVAVLGCSKLTFVVACESQKVPEWIDAHNKMLIFFGGVTYVIVPDNLKSAVIKAGPEPKINRTYLEWAVHNGTVIAPAGVGRPQDKSHAEIGVQIANRWIMAPLRHRKFFSIEEINAAIAEQLKVINNKPFKKLPGSRQELFDRLDKPKLLPLPAETFEPTSEWVSKQKVRSDYHIVVDLHHYSVPYQLVGSTIEVRITSKSVEVFCNGKRVATHIRSYEKGGSTTLTEHQPKAHRKYAEQTPDYFINWAKEIGEATSRFVEYQLNRTPHYLPGVRVCSSLIRLGKQYGSDRLELACERAGRIGSLTLKSVKSILRHNLDALEELESPVQGQLPLHQNVRGPSYYAQEV